MKNMGLNLFLLFILSLNFTGFVGAQEKKQFGNIGQVIESPEGSQWIRFNSDMSILPGEVFKTNKALFELGIEDEMELVRTRTDRLGHAHHRYQQTYQGIEVEGGQFIVHTEKGVVKKANGRLAKDLKIDTNPTLSVETAFEVALKYVDAVKYKWEDPVQEALLKEVRNDKNASFYPEGKLVITPPLNSASISKKRYSLAYKFDIYTQIPDDGKSVYVNAHTGQIVNDVSLVSKCENGTGCTLHNGDRSFYTEHVSGQGYRLWDHCRGDGIRTKFVEEDIWYHLNVWSEPEHCRSVSAHWATETTYDYFSNVHSWTSFVNPGSQMINIIQETCEGPSWNGTWASFARYCDRSSGYMVSLDVVGHEWTHAINDQSAELWDSGEPGALCESFADIFGTMVEFYIEGSSGNYLIAEDSWLADGYLRNMADPGAKNEVLDDDQCPDDILDLRQPDTYQGNNWFFEPNFPFCDRGGIHINSGVQNYWFYLLSEGGSGSNDFNKPYRVEAIGRDAAAEIAFRNLTVYLHELSGYYDAKIGAIWAAEDLYGFSSHEVTQVARAWFAVGVTSDIEIWLDDDQTVDGAFVYFAEDHIYAGPYTVSSTGKVLLVAGDQVRLQDGFKANKSSQFRALWAGNNSSASKQNAGQSTTSSAVPKSAQNTKQDAIKGTDAEMAKASPALPTEFSLSQNYPNPFNPETVFEYGLPEDTHVTLKIYNMLGQEVVTLVDQYQLAGFKRVLWNGANNIGKRMASGTYIYRIHAGDFVAARKMVIMK